MSATKFFILSTSLFMIFAFDYAAIQRPPHPTRHSARREAMAHIAAMRRAAAARGRGVGPTAGRAMPAQRGAAAVSGADADLQAALAASMQDFSLQSRNKGLENCGNGCYFNSSLQALSHLDTFNALLTSRLDDKDDFIVQCYMGLLEKIKGAGVIKCSEKLPLGIEFKDFYSSVGARFFPSSIGKEQDAGEMIVRFLDLVFMGRANLRDLFNTEISTEVHGIGIALPSGEYISKCTHGFSRQEDAILLSLPIPDQKEPYVLYDSLAHYSDYNTIDWNCGVCGSVKATVAHYLNRLPQNYLTIQFNRFIANVKKGVMEKVCTPMLFPLYLEFDGRSGLLSHELRQELQAGGQKIRYDLVAFIIHSGDFGGGHYWAYGKAQDEKWYVYDDQRVETKDIMEILNSGKDGAGTPYILFYERHE